MRNLAGIDMYFSKSFISNWKTNFHRFNIFQRYRYPSTRWLASQCYFTKIIFLKICSFFSVWTNTRDVWKWNSLTQGQYYFCCQKLLRELSKCSSVVNCRLFSHTVLVKLSEVSIRKRLIFCHATNVYLQNDVLIMTTEIPCSIYDICHYI